MHVCQQNKYSLYTEIQRLATIIYNMVSKDEYQKGNLEETIGWFTWYHNFITGYCSNLVETEPPKADHPCLFEREICSL